jgi:predicted HAD superfamily phosphohydrolase YqeG
MTRAPEGRYVNLTDCKTPEDVYQLVADITKKHGHRGRLLDNDETVRQGQTTTSPTARPT